MKHLHPYGETCLVGEELPKTKAQTQRAFITVECVARGCFPFRGKKGLEFPIDDIPRVYNVTGWEFVWEIWQ